MQALWPADEEADGMTPLRSFLFIPGDSEKKLGKADGTGADALILDLEDSVAPARKQAARELVLSFLKERPRGARKSRLWVRINPLDTDLTLTDLAAIMAGAPDGLMLPKVNGPDGVRVVSLYLDAFEAAYELPKGSTQILPVVTETARAPFALGDYADANLARLYGLTWGAEDLSSAIKASTNLDPVTGQWAFTYKIVRSWMLLGAHAAGVEAVDTLYVDFKDPQGLRNACRAARAEGFSGRVAIHPAQVDIINESFAPSAEEIEFAERVIAAFAASPDSGTVGLEGKMLDIPHLKQAQGVIAQAALYNKR